MKIGKTLDRTNLFDKSVDTSDDITEGAAQLFYPDADKTKVSFLPVGANQYLEIEQSDTEPATPVEGDVYYNTTDSKFYLYEDTAWVEVVFGMLKEIP